MTTARQPQKVMTVAPQLMQPAPVTPAPRMMPAAEGQYAVGNDDTLWQIALKTRPSRSVSPQQMMLAIQRANPGAFIDNNINKLRSGVVLDIPTQGDIDAMALQNPVTEVQRQNSAWRGGSDTGKPDAAPKTEQLDAGNAASDGAAASSGDSQLRIVSKAPVEEEAAEVPAKVSSDTSDAEQSSAVEQELVAKNRELEEQLVVTLEGLDKVERDNAEMFQRLEQISEQMAAMQRLIELKDQQLAELQNRAAQTPAQAAPAPAPAAPERSLVDSLMQSPAALGGIGAGLLALLGGLFWFLRKRKSDEAAEEAAVQEAMAALDAEEATSPKVAEAGVAAVAAAAAVNELAEVDEEALPVEEDPNDPFNAVSDEDVNEFAGLDDSDDLDMDLKIDEPVVDDLDLDEFSESLLSDEDYDLAVDDAATDEEQGDAEAAEADALDDLDFVLGDSATDEAPSEASAADDLDDELEAILAGDDSSAAETSEASSADELEDDLDALLAGNDLDLPVEDAAEEASADDAFDDSDLDALLAEDGQEESEQSGANEAMTVDGEDDLESLNIETVEPLTDEEEVETDDALDALLAEGDGDDEPTGADEIDLGAVSAIDLEMDDDGEASELADEVPEEPEEPVPSDEDEDLTVGELLLEEEVAEPEAKPEPEVEEPQVEESNEVLDSLLDGLPESDDAEADLDALAAEIDGGLSLEDDEAVPTEASAKSEASGVSGLVLEDNLDAADDEDLEAELNLMLEQEGNDLALEESGADEALDYLEDADEVGTKLDLARAYVDMDDSEGAADILAEVIKEGNDDQVKEAQQLLDSLKS